MKYRIRHTTEYAYVEPVSTCQNLVHLTPRNLPHQRCDRFSLSVQPAPTDGVDAYMDYFGNAISAFAIYHPHNKLVITADSDVEVDDNETPQLPASLPWEQARELMWAATTGSEREKGLRKPSEPMDPDPPPHPASKSAAAPIQTVRMALSPSPFPASA